MSLWKSVNTAQYYTLCVMADERLWNTYINVINVEDFGLEEQPQRSGLLDGVSQLTVRLRTGTRKHTSDMNMTELKWAD